MGFSMGFSPQPSCMETWKPARRKTSVSSWDRHQPIGIPIGIPLGSQGSRRWQGSESSESTTDFLISFCMVESCETIRSSNWTSELFKMGMKHVETTRWNTWNNQPFPPSAVHHHQTSPRYQGIQLTALCLVCFAEWLSQVVILPQLVISKGQLVIKRGIFRALELEMGSHHPIFIIHFLVDVLWFGYVYENVGLIFPMT